MKSREEVVEAKEDAVEDAVEEDSLDILLEENADIISNLSEEQLELFDKIVLLLKR